MPLVGNKHFAYTSKGMKQALAHAEKTGQKVRVDKKGLGGMVKKYNEGGMLKGKSHKQGGIPAVVGGNQPIEMEGGEYVIKKDAAKKLGPDILNYINKTGSVPKMEKGGQVAKRTAGHAEKKMSRRALAEKSLASKGIDSEAMFNMINPMGGTTKVAKAVKKAGGLAPYYAKEAYKRINSAIKTGQINKLSAADTQLFKRSLKESLGKKKMSEGGEVNPYLKEYKAAREGEMAALAKLPQLGSDEYEKLKRERTHKTASSMSNPFDTGQRRWQKYQGDMRRASSTRKAIAKRGKARAEQAMGIGGQGSMAMFGGLKARGHQKEAARQMQYRGGGRIDGPSLFSLLKKLGR